MVFLFYEGKGTMNNHNLANIFVIGVIFGFVSFIVYIAIKSRIEGREDKETQ